MTLFSRGTKCLLLYFSDFDIRIPPTVDMEKFEVKIQEWCKNAGEEVTYECLQVSLMMHVTQYSIRCD